MKSFGFEIHQAPSEITANCQANPAFLGRFFFHWAAAILKCSVDFKIKKSRPFFIIILCQKCQFQDSRFWSTYTMTISWCESASILRIPKRPATAGWNLVGSPVLWKPSSISIQLVYRPHFGPFGLCWQEGEKSGFEFL